MPIVKHLDLPSFEDLDGLSLEQATHQDIRELHIGLLNMMPDAALQVTERQYLRLVGNCNQIAQFYVHPFTVPGLTRSPESRAYLDRYYLDPRHIQAMGLDALIITGANVTHPDLAQEPFWRPLMEILAWASQNVTSVLCSCLATHAVLQHHYHIHRQPLERKRWGVYVHRQSRRPHPLLRDINTRFDVPHSRWNTVTAAQMEAHGVTPLVLDESGEVHLAVSPDGLRVVYSQGHPEYEINSLLKEYKREVLRFQNGQLEAYPPFPDHYFFGTAAELAQQHRLQPHSPFPEDEIGQHLDNTWGDSGKAVFNNWLGLVYQLTHLDRHRPFLEGVDPNNPLNLRR